MFICATSANMTLTSERGDGVVLFLFQCPSIVSNSFCLKMLDFSLHFWTFDNNYWTFCCHFFPDSLMYWTDLGVSPFQSRLFMSWMNGENMRPITTATRKLAQPTSLSIDYTSNDTVYWCDSRADMIGYITYDGSLFRIIAQGGQSVDLFHSNPHTGMHTASLCNSLPVSCFPTICNLPQFKRNFSKCLSSL